MVNALPLGSTAIAFSIIGTLFALARLYTRGVLLRALKWDDFFLALALLSGIGGFGVIVLMAFRDLAAMPKESAGRKKGTMFYFEFAILAMICYTLQNMFSRLSLLMSYRSFNPKDSRRWQHHLVNLVIVLTLLSGIIFTFAEIFPCWPIHAMTYPDDWEDRRKYNCLAPREIFQWSGFAGIPLDFAIYLLPFWLVRSIKIRKEQRYGLYGMFAFGGFVFIVSVIRVPFLVVLDDAPLYSMDLERLMLMWILTVVEANLLLCAASVPTLRPLWRAIRGQDVRASLQQQPKGSAGRDTPSGFSDQV